MTCGAGHSNHCPAARWSLRRTRSRRTGPNPARGTRFLDKAGGAGYTLGKMDPLGGSREKWAMARSTITMDEQEQTRLEQIVIDDDKSQSGIRPVTVYRNSSHLQFH